MFFRKIALIVLLCASLFGCSSSPTLAFLPHDATIVAFGDSLTFGFGVKKNESYPAVLARLIDRKVINAGVNGLKTGEALKLLPGLLEEYHPNLVILGIGGNDLLRRVSHKVIKKNIEQMINWLKAHNIDVLLIAAPKPGVFLSAPGFYQEIGEAYDIPVELNLIGKLERKTDLKSDAIHFNAAGYNKMAERIAALLNKLGAL